MVVKALQNNKLPIQRKDASRPIWQFQRNGVSRPVGQNRRACAQPQRGAVLICVMVVLLIVGLLISQTLQTLLLVRRGDEARAHLRQARELVELGEIVLQQNPPAESIGEVRCDIETHANALESGTIVFERLNFVEDARKQIRISVTYRLGSSSKITATHVVAESENLP